MGEFRLGLVIVDVVVAHDAEFGCVAGLSGAQDDAQLGELEFPADDGDQVEAGLRGLHHHVQQHDRDLRALCLEDRSRLAGAAGVQQPQGSVQHRGVLQREHRRVMHLVVVVDDQHGPYQVAAAAVVAAAVVVEIVQEVDQIITGNRDAQGCLSLGTCVDRMPGKCFREFRDAPDIDSLWPTFSNGAAFRLGGSGPRRHRAESQQGVVAIQRNATDCAAGCCGAACIGLNL